MDVGDSGFGCICGWVWVGEFGCGGGVGELVSVGVMWESELWEILLILLFLVVCNRIAWDA